MANNTDLLNQIKNIVHEEIQTETSRLKKGQEEIKQAQQEQGKKLDKSKRVNSYKVKYMKFNGQYEELTFNQG